MTAPRAWALGFTSMDSTDKPLHLQQVRRELDARGEDFVKEQLAGMPLVGFQFLLNGASTANQLARQGMKEAEIPGNASALENFTESLQATASNVEHPVRADVVVEIVRWYREKFGDAEGWDRFCKALNVAQLAKRLAGQVTGAPRMLVTPDRKGCGSVILLLLLALFVVALRAAVESTVHSVEVTGSNPV